MKLTRILSTLAVAALATLSSTSTAAPGDLDLTFGGTGKVITDIGSTADRAYGVALQADGKIVVAGARGFGIAVVRYKTDGTLDTSFNGTGKVITSVGSEAVARSVVVQADQKIVVAGYSVVSGNNWDFAVIRYNTDGSLDTSFNGTGIVTANFGGKDVGQSVALQSDQKIVVAGWTLSNAVGLLPVVIRYNTDGSLDASFNGSGTITEFAIYQGQGYDVAVQTDQKIVVTGYSVNNGINADEFAVWRFNVNGTPDNSFNGTGKVTKSFGSGSVASDSRPYSVALQSDSKIVVAGFVRDGTTHNFALMRFNANGTLDSDFNGIGRVVTHFSDSSDFANGVAIQSDGKIVAAGFSGASGSSDFALVRYDANGYLDTSFNGDGKLTTDFGGRGDTGQCVAIQGDGRIVVGGYSSNGVNDDFALARYESDIDTDTDGIPDRFETGTGTYVSPEDTGTSPTNPDSDGDGLTDGQEVYTHHSNPNIKDTDADGFDDGFEVSTGFSPTSAASTPDALSSIRTAAEYRFNAANGISYRIEASTDLANWTTIETNIVGSGGVITRFYSIEGQPKRYFRSRRN